MSTQSSFGIIGGAGFRANFFIRIAEACPHLFRVCGIVGRDKSKIERAGKTHGLSTFDSLDSLLKQEKPDFMVVSVSPSVCGEYLIRLHELGIPALTETPPATDLASLQKLHDQLTSKGARVQVAEQYQFQPMHAARFQIVESGGIGNISQATVSISQSYHGLSLMRRMLSVGFSAVRVRGMSFKSSFLNGPSRSGPPPEEKLVDTERKIAWLEFGDKLGIFDFTNNQHRSYIRSNNISVWGERGEIFDDRVTQLADYKTPLYLDMKRIIKGEYENLEGHYLEGVLVGERWVYRNEFIPARLYDDEIAIATCMMKMVDYAEGGPSFYSLAEASQDVYLGILIDQAIQSGEAVESVDQPWMNA